MTLAEDNNTSIFCQDTDSIHIHIANMHNNIPTLSKLFQLKYNHQLIGKNMGQFHSDFSLKDANGKPCKDINITSVTCIFNEEMCCINRDNLQYYNEDGNGVYGYHVIA